MSRIVLGVAGGIAAYKACELLRRLTEAGHDVTVVPTPAALDFVGATTWAALSGKPIRTQVTDDAHEVPHVRLGRTTDLVVVAPATADLIARAAAGRADDLLTNVLLTSTAPLLLCPAMHTEMWLHPATQDNVATLRRRGAIVLDPAVGRLTGADSGPGRLPEPDDIAAVASALLDGGTAKAARRRDLAGRRVVISAGGTREPLDPVRFLANASSGRMGIALARAAALRGAGVTLVSAGLSDPAPSGCTVVPVVTTEDLDAAMREHAGTADLIVMAAAPADFTAEHPSGGKLSKQTAVAADGSLTVRLVQTPDVLAGLVRARTQAGSRQVIVGFAAETPEPGASLAEIGEAKRSRKGCDLLVVNDVTGGAVFGQADTAVTIVGGSEPVAFAGSKQDVAHRILDRAGLLLAAG